MDFRGKQNLRAENDRIPAFKQNQRHSRRKGGYKWDFYR